MSSPSEPLRRAQIRKAAWTLALLAAIAVLALWAISSGAQQASAPRPSSAEKAQQGFARFAGASASRLFLSPAESREASRRGLIPAGTRSILATGGKLEHGEWRWDDAGVPSGPVAIRVDLARQLVSVFVGPHEVGTAVILYGAEGKQTPRGRLPILGKSRDYHSRTYDAPMPYSLWLNRDGVAMHGSSVSMGRATNGCIGVPVDFARKVFERAKKGDIVEVIGGKGQGRV